jgi:outer membrane receptor protein involved in Fe transport
MVQGAGEYFADDANTISVPSYNILNSMMGFDDLNLYRGRLILNLSAGVENITDEKYAASAYINPDRGRISNEPIYLEPGLPRNWVTTMSLKWKF